MNGSLRYVTLSHKHGHRRAFFRGGSDKPWHPQVSWVRLGQSRVNLIKIAARPVRRARRLVFEIAEVALPREVFPQVLEHIDRLHPAPG